MLDEIHSFIVLAECMNFSTATNFLYITQPTLSKQISRLEEELGVKLFKRTTRSVELTSAGAEFLEMSHKYYNFCQSLPTNYPRHSLKQGNRDLVIGIPNNAKAFVIESLLGKYIGEHSNTSVSFVQEEYNSLFKYLDEKEIDFIYTFKSMIEDNQNYDYQVVRKIKLHAVLWKNHPLANMEKIKMSDLINEPMIIDTAAPPVLRETFYAFFEANEFFPKVAAKVDSPQLSALMVAAQQGIALTTYLLEGDNISNIVYKEIEMENGSEKIMDNSFVLAWRKKGYESYKPIQHFVDFMREVYSEKE